MKTATSNSPKLKTEYPCCKGIARFATTNLIPRERYSRKCSHCGITWDVLRTTASDNGDVRIDTLEWGIVT